MVPPAGGGVDFSGRSSWLEEVVQGLYLGSCKGRVGGCFKQAEPYLAVRINRILLGYVLFSCTQFSGARQQGLMAYGDDSSSVATITKAFRWPT